MVLESLFQRVTCGGYLFVGLNVLALLLERGLTWLIYLRKDCHVFEAFLKVGDIRRCNIWNFAEVL